MSAESQATNQSPAIVKARRRWKGVAEVVSREAMQKSGARSSWLADHAGRRNRGVKGADQMHRMACTMRDEGFSQERATLSLTAFVEDVVTDAYQQGAERDGAA